MPINFVVDLPISLEMGKKKKKTFYLNLNVYRNSHFHVLNNAKIMFEEAVKSRLGLLPKMSRFRLTYTLFPASERSRDVSNVCSIVDKFFCDTLVNAGIIPDDNMEIISNVSYQWGNADKNNPRVEATISDYELAQEDKPMLITLVQSEIEDAIKAYVLRSINIASAQNISVEMKASRGEDGFTATLNVSKEALAASVTPLTAYIAGSIEEAAIPFDIAPTGSTGSTGSIGSVGSTGSAGMTAAQAESITKPNVSTPAPSKPSVPQTEPKKVETKAPVAEQKAEPAKPGAATEAPPKAETPKPTDKSEGLKPATQEAVSAPVTGTKTVFPTKETSAPAAPPATPKPAPVATAPAPAGGGKSLFANLKPPVHDTPAAQ